MTEQRSGLTFKRPGEPTEPTTVVIVTTVQLVDASGVPVRTGTGRAVRPCEAETVGADLALWADGVAEAGLHLAVIEQEEEETAEAIDTEGMTKAQLQAVLDERGIEYAAKATRDELVALV